MKRSSILILILGVTVAAAAIYLSRPQPVSAAATDFFHRVRDYVRLHETVEQQLPPFGLSDSGAAIEEHQRDLAARIVTARAEARQGNIFTPEISAEFRSRLRHALQPPAAINVSESLDAAEPVRLKLAVNEAYPISKDVPLQSMPPAILMALPNLPDQLEYRIVGDSLILRDATANLVVDYIPDIYPLTR